MGSEMCIRDSISEFQTTLRIRGVLQDLLPKWTDPDSDDSGQVCLRKWSSFEGSRMEDAKHDSRRVWLASITLYFNVLLQVYH